MISSAPLLLLTAAGLLAPSVGANPAAAAAEKTATAIACTATSTKGGSFFDLRPDIAVAPADKKKEGGGLGSKYKRGPSEDYAVKGYDFGYNFTLNICDAVLKAPTDVVGLESSAYKNVSAYYTTEGGKVYSIGYV